MQQVRIVAFDVISGALSITLNLQVTVALPFQPVLKDKGSELYRNYSIEFQNQVCHYLCLLNLLQMYMCMFSDFPSLKMAHNRNGSYTTSTSLTWQQWCFREIIKMFRYMNYTELDKWFKHDVHNKFTLYRNRQCLSSLGIFRFVSLWIRVNGNLFISFCLQPSVVYLYQIRAHEVTPQSIGSTPNYKHLSYIVGVVSCCLSMFKFTAYDKNVF